MAAVVALALVGGPAGAQEATPWRSTPEPVVGAADLARLETAPAEIDDDWPRSTPVAEGVDPRPVATLLKRIDDGSYVAIDAVVIARNGHLLAERYYGDYGATRLHQTRSTFKSITGLLTGIAIADGILAPEMPVAPLIARFHAPADGDARKQAITVDDFLQMASGFDCDEMPGRGPHREDAANKSADRVAAHFDLPMADAPGGHWRYCSSNTFLLGVALNSALLQNTYFGLGNYLHDRLFGPLEIRSYRLGGQTSAHLSMHGGARMRPRDLAKIGQLVVAGGRWRDRQVVPAAWIGQLQEDGAETGWSWTDSLGVEAAFQRTSKYRHQWFQTDLAVAGRDVRLIHSWGNGGQFIVAVPSRALVVVVTASNYGARNLEKQKQVFHMLHRYLLPAVAP